MEDIVIIGSGGFAIEVAFLIEEINRKNMIWNILGFIVNEKEDIGKSIGKYIAFNTDEWLLKSNDKVSVAFGIGTPKIVEKLAGIFSVNKMIQFPNLIHPNVTGDWQRITMGSGNIVCANNAFTTEIRIGSFNIFNLSGTIGHNVEIGNCNIINPSSNISGGVNIQNRVSIGTGTQVLQYLNICSDTVIGAGSVVTKNIVEPGVYVGIPVKKIK